MIKLYAAPRTRSLRVAWLLEELGQPYELTLDEFIQTKSEFFIQNTPTGKYPTIDDDGFIMFESGAIIEYLIEKFDDKRLMPRPGTIEKAECLQWMHFADATAFSPLGIVIWLAVYRSDAEENAELIKDARVRAETAFTILEKQLAGKNYILGENFSAADIMLGFTVMAASLLGIVAEGSNLGGYLKRLQSREAFKIALDKTGGFSA